MFNFNWYLENQKYYYKLHARKMYVFLKLKYIVFRVALLIFIIFTVLVFSVMIYDWFACIIIIKKKNKN